MNKARRLRFSEDPPDLVFVGTVFTVKIVSEEEEAVLGKSTIENFSLVTFGRCVGVWRTINVSLRNDNGTRVAKIGGENIIFTDNGCCVIDVCIDDVTPNSSRYFHLAAATDDDVTLVAKSKPFKIVRHRLFIEDDRGWKDTWFKDVGGQRNCIEVPVRLLDHRGEIIASRDLPLRITLLFEDGTRVDDQSILTLYEDASGQKKRREIDQVVLEKGSANVHLRIGKVSKVHGCKRFVVKIEQDPLKSPDQCDVSPVLSKPVEVKSKPTPSKKKRPRLEEDAHHEFSLYFGDQSSQSVSSHSVNSIPAPINVDSRRDAMLSWISEASKTLSSLKWIPRGFAQNEDGSEDFENPLFTIPNPNEAIAKLERSYREHNLHLILRNDV